MEQWWGNMHLSVGAADVQDLYHHSSTCPRKLPFVQQDPSERRLSRRLWRGSGQITLEYSS